MEPIVTAAPRADAPSQGLPHRLLTRFVGSGSEYFRIWIVNLLLTLLTLGLYYPFAKVRRLKYFHAATEVGGHPLSFHADPWKMLRGYVLVAVLVGLYSLAGQVSPLAGLIAFFIIAGLWPALWHSSLRFRMINTGWRGLRFRFAGDRGGAYRALLPLFVPGLAVLVTAWLDSAGPAAPAGPPELPGLLFWVVSVATLLAFPAMLWSMKRYQHDHYALGAEQTRFTVALAAYYGLFLRGVGLFLLATLVAGALIGGVSAVLIWLVAGDRSTAGAIGVGVAMVGALIGVVVFQAAVGPWFTARLQNLVWRGTRSAHLSFDSDLGFRALAILSAKNWLLIIITLGLYIPFAAVRVARLRLETVAMIVAVDPDTLVAQAGLRGESAAGDAAGDLLGIDIGL